MKTYQPSEYKKIKSFERFLELEKSIIILEEKIGEEKEEQLKTELNQILIKIEKIKIGNVYECPQCSSHLILKNQKLLKTEEEVSIIDSSSSILQKELNKFKKN